MSTTDKNAIRLAAAADAIEYAIMSCDNRNDAIAMYGGIAKAASAAMEQSAETLHYGLAESKGILDRIFIGSKPIQIKDFRSSPVP